MTFQVTNPDTKTDAGALELDGADSIVSADVGGFTYVFVAGGVDDGVSVFRLNANGTLTSVANVTDDATLKLDGARGLSTAMVEGNTYLFAAGQVDNGVSVFRVGTNGSLTSVANVSEDATLFLNGVTDTATARVGTSTYLFTTGTADDGVSIFRVAGNGALTNVGNLADNGTIKLDGVDALATVSVGGTSFLIAAGGVDDGLSVFSIAANGTLTNTNNFSDNGTLNLNGASDVTTAVIGGVTYVFVAGAADNGVSVFSLNGSGILTNISNVTDSASTLFAGASSVSVSTIGQTTYLSVGGTESGFSLFRVESGNNGSTPGTLTFMENVPDTAGRALGGSTTVGSASVGGTNYMLGAGATEDGVSTFGSTVTGQLFYFGSGDPTDSRLAYLNNDGGNQTVIVDNNPTVDLKTAFPEEVGLDTAAGFYFAIVNGGPALGDGAMLVRGSLAGGAATTLFTYPGPDNILGNSDDGIVNAMQIDVISHKIYVGIQFYDGSTPTLTGIRQYTYDPLTGGVVDNGFIATRASSNKPQESGFDVLDVRDFALDTTTHNVFFTERLDGGVNVEGLWRFNQSTPNTMTQVVSQAQFPDNHSNGYIIDVEVDRTTGLLYFDTESQKAFGNPGYNAALNQIWWIDENAVGGTATLLSFTGGIPAGHFYPGDMQFDPVTRQLYVETEETDIGSGADTDDVIYVFQLDATGHTASLINTITLNPAVTNIAANIDGMAFNSIPALTGISGTATHAGEQGAAITLLTATPTITDTDGDHLASATVQITGGLFSSNESNATDDHLAYGVGLQTSGLIAGTNITLAFNAATGTLTLTGYDTLANYQNALAQIRYFATGDNPTNYGLDTTRTITWTVSDGALNIPGGAQNSATTSITIDAVNDGPTNNLPSAQTTNEDVAKAITGLSFSDPDANPALAAITVTLSVQHGTLTLLTNVAGGLTAGELANNGTATVTVTGTLDEINATLASATGLTYASIADYNGSDTLHIVTNDGGNTGSGGALTDTDDLGITITPVADIVNDTPSVAEDSGANTLNLLANDTFENATRFISGVTQGTHGSVAINDNGTPADNTDDFVVYTVTDANYNGSDSFQYTVTSPTGITETATVNVTVTAVNDPVSGAAPATLSLAEDSTNIAVSGLSISDVDTVLAPAGVYNVTLSSTHGTMTMTTLTGLTFTAGDGTSDATMTFHGTLAAINTALATAKYTPTGDYNGTDAAGITLQVTDTFGGIVATGTGAATNDSDSISVTVTPVNDAPVFAALNGTPTFTEGGAAVVLDNNATITDVDLTATNYAGATLTLARSGAASAQDVFGTTGTLSFDAPGSGNVLVGATNVGTFTQSGGTLVITFGVNATQTLVNSTLDQLTYSNNSDNPPASAVIAYTFSDGNSGAQGPGGPLTASGSATVTITPTNDAPTAIVPGSVGTATEQTAFSIKNAGLSVGDIDGNSGSETVTLAVGQGVLNVTAGTSGAGVSGSGTNTVTITGTITQINALLNTDGTSTVSYFNSSDAPAASTSLTLTINDNGATGGGNLSGSASGTISITAVNDGPVNTVPGAQTINEDGTATFSGTISVADADAGASGVTVTLSVAHGTLSLNPGALGTLSFGAGDGTADATMTFSGTTANINAALNGLVYTPTADYHGSDTLSITTNDNGNTGTPGALQDVDTVTINITAVADIQNDSVSATEDTPANLDLLANDNFENAGRTITSVTQGLHGTVTINDNGNGPGSDDFVVYTPNADYNGADSFTYTVTSGGVTETATVNVNVSAVADIANDSQTTAEDTPVDVPVLGNDTFEGTPAITNVGAAAHGIAVLNDNGTPGDTTDDFIVYTPNADYNGSDSFTYTVTSGGVTETATVTMTITAGADIVDDSVSVLQDGGSNSLNLLANDNFESAARFISAVTAALHGTTAINNNGTPGNTADDFVTYTPTAGYQGPDNFTYTVTSGGVTETANVSVNVGPPDIAPVVDLDTGTAGIDATANFVEGGGAVALGPTIGVSDADVGDMIHGATIAISDPEAGDILVANLPFPGGITIDLGSSTADFMVLTGTASAADYATALGQIGFDSSSDDQTVGGTHNSRSIGVTVNDGALNSAPATSTINVFGVNDEPTLAATGQNPTYTENGAAVDLFSAVTASTVEANQTLTSLTLTVSNVTDGSSEILAIDGSNVALTNGNIVTTATHGLSVGVSLSGSTATVTFSGASLSAGDLQTLVDTLTYANSSENPTDADRVVTIIELVDSGSNSAPNDNTTSLSISSTVNVDPVNDAASITGTATGSVTEAGGINNGTPGTPTATGDLDSTDVDNTADAWKAVVAGTATANHYGTYALDGAGVWTYTLDDNNAAVQALNGVATLTDTFTALTVDGTSQLVTVTIHAQDDIGTAQPDAVATDEATALNGNVFANNGSGADSDVDGLVVTAVNGSGAVVGTQITLGSGAHLTLNANGTFSYDPNHAFDATPIADSGGSNTPAHDVFSYTIAGGGTASVTVTIAGLDGNDTVLGSAGNDLLDGGAGTNTLIGGTGDDIYVASNSDVVVEAPGEGFDRVYALTNYTLSAGSEVEVLVAGGLDPNAPFYLTGNELDNNIWANAGDNVLDGGGGNDAVFGFDGNDVAYGGDGNDFVVGGNGSDALFGGTGQDVLLGQAGNDYLDGGTGADVMWGGDGNDIYVVDNAGDIVNEGANGGLDRVYALTDYTLTAGSEVEVLAAGGFNPTASISLVGNELANNLWDNAGDNLLSGAGGNDAVFGFDGNDILFGGTGDDLLVGGNGNDTLYGGTGIDVLIGGSGSDSFVFNTAPDPSNVDTVADFTSGTDKIALDHAVFDGLALGSLPAVAFHVGTEATDEDQRIIYDDTTGTLYYDADGAGGADAIAIATLQGHPPLTGADFVVF